MKSNIKYTKEVKIQNETEILKPRVAYLGNASSSSPNPNQLCSTSDLCVKLVSRGSI